jgi:hypothetical protein
MFLGMKAATEDRDCFGRQYSTAAGISHGLGPDVKMRPTSAYPANRAGDQSSSSSRDRRRAGRRAENKRNPSTAGAVPSAGLQRTTAAPLPSVGLHQTTARRSPPSPSTRLPLPSTRQPPLPTAPSAFWPSQAAGQSAASEARRPLRTRRWQQQHPPKVLSWTPGIGAYWRIPILAHLSICIGPMLIHVSVSLHFRLQQLSFPLLHMR